MVKQTINTLAVASVKPPLSILRETLCNLFGSLCLSVSTTIWLTIIILIILSNSEVKKNRSASAHASYPSKKNFSKKKQQKIKIQTDKSLRT